MLKSKVIKVLCDEPVLGLLDFTDFMKRLFGCDAQVEYSRFGVGAKYVAHCILDCHIVYLDVGL